MHLLACLNQMEMYCWGYNNVGQLGDGSNTDRNRPTETNADNYHPNINITQISVGSTHTCALDSDSELLCWGNEGYYRLGNGQSSGYTSYPSKYTSQSEVYGKQLATVSAVVNTHVQSDMMLKHGVGEWATTVKSGMVLYIHLVLCQKSLNTQTTNLQLVFHSDILIHVQL